MFCTNCGSQLKDGVKFCTKCGKPVKLKPVQQEPAASMHREEDTVFSGGGKRETAAEYRQEPEVQDTFAATEMETYPNRPAMPSTQNPEIQYTMKAEETAESFEDEFEEEREAEAAFYEPHNRKKESKKRTPVGLMIAGGVAAVAILGGTAFFVGTQLGNRAVDKQEIGEESAAVEEETSAGTLEAAETTEALKETLQETTRTVETTPAETEAPVIHAVLGTISDLTGLSQYPVGAEDTYQSSYAAPSAKGKNVYYASKAFDGLPETSWQDGVDGDGIGEEIGCTFANGCNVKALTLQLGNHRSEDWYVKNNRPKTLTIELGDYSFQVNFSDEMKEHILVFSSPISTSRLNLRVDAVYPGSMYQDTAIAEVGVFYE